MKAKKTLRKVTAGKAKIFYRRKPVGVEERRAHELAKLLELRLRGWGNRRRRANVAALRRKLGV